jgi:hypothetical protein
VSFLAPFWLALAGAAAVPLLIHLLRRRIGARVEFPAVRYLVRAEQEHSRKLRLRNLLIMFLRVFAVLCVAAAAARPVGRVAGVGHAPTALAFVLDNSLSTSAVVDGSPVLERLKRVARGALSQAAVADRVWLVTADGRVTGGSGAAVLRAIEDARPLAGAGDLATAVRRAAALVRAAGLPEGSVAVLTDGQATSWRVPIALEDARVAIYEPALRAPPNAAVTAAAAVPTRWTPGGTVEARVLAPAESALYRITLTGPRRAPRTLARGTAAAPRGGGEASLMVRAAPPERGWVAGAVELEPDELRGDDTRHFAVWIGPAPRVAVDPSAGPFVRSAVDALVEGGRAQPGLDVRVAAADALTQAPALIFAPSDPVRVGAANRALERAGIPWRFGAPRRGEMGVRFAGQAGRVADDVSAAARYALVARAGAVADTVARVGQEPWIAAGPGYVLVASPIDPQATSFPLRASFLPWLADAVSELAAAGAGQVLQADAGARVARPAGVEALERAEGARIPASGDSLAVPEQPGVYFLIRDGERRGALVVNVDPGESVLARLSAAQLRSRVQARQVDVSADDAKWAGLLFASSARRSLIAPLLVAALAALVAEALAARTGRGATRRSADAPPTPQRAAV